LYDKIVFTWDDEKLEDKPDFRDVITDLVAELTNSPDLGKQLLGEFARSLRGYYSCPESCYLTFREHMLEIDPSLDWVFDSGGLPVYDHLGQSPDILSSTHMFGTWGSDAVKGGASADGWINGLSGDDVIYGTDRNEQLINENGDALLVAGGGNDIIWAGAGNDILDGGTGNDTLYGEEGSDTYIFRRGSGQDTIIDVDTTPGNTDTIWLGSNLTPNDVSLKRIGNNLVLKIIDTTDTLTVKDFFRNDSMMNRVEQR
jgi:hypothetical protein